MRHVSPPVTTLGKQVVTKIPFDFNAVTIVTTVTTFFKHVHVERGKWLEATPHAFSYGEVLDPVSGGDSGDK